MRAVVQRVTEGDVTVENQVTGSIGNGFVVLLGVEDTDALRKQVSAVWESVYQDNSHEISVLANSLWLEKGVQYHQDAMDAVAYHYYASVYQTDLGSESANKAIGNWLNKNTGGLLKNSTDKIDLSPDTVLALYSTLFSIILIEITGNSNRYAEFPA